MTLTSIETPRNFRKLRGSNETVRRTRGAARSHGRRTEPASTAVVGRAPIFRGHLSGRRPIAKPRSLRFMMFSAIALWAAILYPVV